MIATGDYINDDGITVNTTGKMNGYTLNFYQDPSTDFDATFQVRLYERADDYKDKDYKVNENDNLGTLYIYDAEYKQMNKNYTVSIKTMDSTACTDVPDATYDTESNRVIWQANATLIDAKCLLLPNIE